MCPDHWTRVNPDGTEETVYVDCGQSDVFLAPVGTPIEVTGDFATLNVSAGVTGDRLPGTGEEPHCPVYIDGQHFTTLKGTYEELATAFRALVDDYVATKYPRKEASRPVTA